VARLVDLSESAKAVDEEVSRINGSAPPGEHRRLLGVELTARGLESFSTADPPIAKSVRLPDWDEPTKFAWPPPTPSLAVRVVADVARMLPPDGGANWHQEREAREAAEARKRKQGSR
jgi:hypothetical protein